MAADAAAQSQSGPDGPRGPRGVVDWVPRRHLASLLGALRGLGLGLAAICPGPSLPAAEADLLRLGRVTVDPRLRTAYLPARLNQTNGVVEYALVTDYGKTHESLLITEAGPRDLQTALLLLNVRPAGASSLASPGSVDPPPAGSALQIAVTWSHAGRTNRCPLDSLIGLAAGGGADFAGVITGRLRSGPWLFNGSMLSAEGFVAHFEGSIVSLIRDAGAVANSGRADQDDDDIHVPDSARLPPLGTPVTVEFTPAAPLATPTAGPIAAPHSVAPNVQPAPATPGPLPPAPKPRDP